MAAEDPARLELHMPAELVEAIAVRAAELAADMVAARPEPWIDVDQAAEHICAPKSRVYSLVSASGPWNGSRIPHAKDGSRLLFKVSALDAWVAQGGGVRP